MRTRKATINIIVSIITYMVGYIPQFLIRKIFLEALGDNLLGVSSLYSNIIGYLSIAELGIGSAIIYSLYEPYEKRDKDIVSQLINFYSKIYKLIGLFILCMGLIIMPFIHLLIKDNPIELSELRICFMIILVDTAVSYFYSYKQSLLFVNQENYLVSIASTLSKLALSIIQVLILKLIPNFSIFLLAQLFTNLMYYIFLNKYIDHKFSWIDKKAKNLDPTVKRILFRDIKALFIHKFGGVAVSGTDNLIMAAFINLEAVARFNSYNMVLNALKNMFGTAMNSLTPSIGNLLVTRSKEYALEIHNRIFFLTYWISSIVIIICYNCLTQFVILWLGESQIIDNYSLILIYINLYFSMMRTSVEKFKDGSGNFYQDRFAPIIEGILNLIISVISVQYIGMAGIFLGTVISNFAVIFWTKPYITYKYVFQISVQEYYKRYFLYAFIFIVNLNISHVITMTLAKIYTIPMLVANLLVNFFVINALLLIWFAKNKDFKYFYKLAGSKIINNVKE